MSQFIVVSYDIVDDQKRARVARVLKDYGARVQYSVFECKINEKQIIDLKNRLTKAINLKEDSIRIYSVCQECTKKITLIGESTTIQEDQPDYFVI
ncbi:MAG: CRISPR-associated endonuclease Cas2 [bacterium]